MAVEIKGGLGFDLSPLFIVEGMIWALTVHNASPENLKLLDALTLHSDSVNYFKHSTN
jgi:hypothetical protein